MANSVSPLTPTSVLTNHSPAPPLSASDSGYVNFPSPSVIVSIATLRTPDDSSAAVNALPTRYLAANERDELVRTAAIVLGSSNCASPGSAFLHLAKTLVELGSKHGSGVVDDLSLIFKSPAMEMILPGLAYDYQNHFMEEARSCTAGIGVIITVDPSSSISSSSSTTTGVVNVTLKISYATSSGNRHPLLQQTPLRHVQLRHDKNLHANIGGLVKRSLKEERLDHLRRSIVSNCSEALQAAFYGEMTSVCALTVVDDVVRAACAAVQHADWNTFYDTVQEMANTTQLMGWSVLLSKPLRATQCGLDWLELVVSTWSQLPELHKVWHEQHQDAALWNQLDRYLLSHVSAFYSAILTALVKLSDAKNGAPTLCNVLLLKSHMVSLCTPKCSDPSPLLALKQATLTAIHQHWQLELVHRMACVLHPAFKHMRRLDVSDRQRSETYSMIRNLLRQLDPLPSTDHILRNTLDTPKNVAETKRKGARSGELTTATKRHKTSSSSPSPSAPLTPLAPSVDAATFDFSDLADFSLNASDVCGMVPERDELDLYLEEKIIQQDMTELTNVLVYWNNRKNVFPALAQLAFWILSLPPATYAYQSCLSKSDSVVQRLLFHSVDHSSSNSATVALSAME